MAREMTTITTKIPSEWVEPLDALADSKCIMRASLIYELIREALDMPEALQRYVKTQRYRRASKRSSHEGLIVQILISRTLHSKLVASAEKMNWSLQTLVGRIIEIDAKGMPSTTPVQPFERRKFKNEHSTIGKTLGTAHWESYYAQHPRSPNYKLQVSLPLEWQDELLAKSELSGARSINTYVHDILKKRFEPKPVEEKSNDT